MDSKIANQILQEMSSIKKLLILQLINNEIPQRKIAAMLEISEATMSRMIPGGASKRQRKPHEAMQERRTSIDE